ncbi:MULTISPECIES: TraA family conjugative transfer protein [Methylomonas]|nr:TraA family conjugative transfer protein [Methylomonas koyamae]
MKQMKNLVKIKLLVALVAVAGMFLFSSESFAGTGSTEFNAVYTLLTNWMQGSLGKLIAAAFIVVGLIAGVLRNSLMGFAVGVAAGLGLFTAPGIINAVVTATW